MVNTCKWITLHRTYVIGLCIPGKGFFKCTCLCRRTWSINVYVNIIIIFLFLEVDVLGLSRKGSYRHGTNNFYGLQLRRATLQVHGSNSRDVYTVMYLSLEYNPSSGKVYLLKAYPGNVLSTTPHTVSVSYTPS